MMRRRPGTPIEMRSDLPSHVKSVRTTINAMRAMVRKRGRVLETYSSDARADRLQTFAPPPRVLLEERGAKLGERFGAVLKGAEDLFAFVDLEGEEPGAVPEGAVQPCRGRLVRVLGEPLDVRAGDGEGGEHQVPSVLDALLGVVGERHMGSSAGLVVGERGERLPRDPAKVGGSAVRAEDADAHRLELVEVVLEEGRPPFGVLVALALARVAPQHFVDPQPKVPLFRQGPLFPALFLPNVGGSAG